MPNQYRPEKLTLGTLLSVTNPPIVVPEWQRSFSWTTSEVGTFWQDLLAFSALYPNENIAGQEYFLGSIVIVDATDDHLLLDGQQRISTAAILLSVIRDKLGIYNQNAATRTQSRYLGDFDDAKNEFSYKVSMNEYDRDYFKRLILEPRDAAYVEPDAVLASHRRIEKARLFFTEKFDEEYEKFDTPEEAYQWALRVQDVLTNHVSVVAVFSQDEDNASSVFETLNDRGIGLSTPDLVRNLILRRAATATREEIIDLWGEILESERDAPLKTFLRHYWISHYGDVKTQSLYREIKSRIIADDMNSLTLSRHLRDAATIYRDIVAAHSDIEDIEKPLKEIREIAAAILRPLMLSALQTYDDTELPIVLESIVNTYVRHSVIGQLENSRLENVVYRIAQEIRDGKSAANVRAELHAFAPDDEQFARAFATVAIPRRATARYILRQFELEKRTTEELDVAPAKKVHVEHIYPQTPQTGHRLDGHSRLINRIGNLTLLSSRLNAAIKNSPFPEKKPYYEQSELLLTLEVAENDEWTADKIDERQAAMSERAAAMWPTDAIGQ